MRACLHEGDQAPPDTDRPPPPPSAVAACRMGRAACLAAALLLAAVVTTAADRDLLGGPAAAIVNGEPPRVASCGQAVAAASSAAPALPPLIQDLRPRRLPLPLPQARMRPGDASATCARYGTRLQAHTFAEVRATGAELQGGGEAPGRDGATRGGNVAAHAARACFMCWPLPQQTAWCRRPSPCRLTHPSSSGADRRAREPGLLHGALPPPCCCCRRPCKQAGRILDAASLLPPAHSPATLPCPALLITAAVRGALQLHDCAVRGVPPDGG